MAAGAGLSKGSAMLIRMAGNTTGRGALENVVGMAPGTGCTDVRTGQLEG